jgi:hypothetical protein
MFKRVLLMAALALPGFGMFGQKVIDAKDAVKEMDKKDVKEGWTTSGAVGLDLSILQLINPRIGSGVNQTKFGGLVNFGAKYNKGKYIWDNKGSWLMSVVSETGPATKSVDAFQFTSQAGYEVAPKWYIAGLFDVQTQLLPTYGKNFFTETYTDPATNAQVTNKLTGSFLAPGIIKFAPGIIYKYDSHLTFLLSPVAIRAVTVFNDDLAKRAISATSEYGIYGNPWRSATDYDKVDLQIGAELRADYTNKFLEDKLIYSSTLDIYSNYKKNPQNMAIEWYNSLDYMITKKIALSFKSDWFYDHNILVDKSTDPVKTDFSRGTFIRNALLLSYKTTF